MMISQFYRWQPRLVLFVLLAAGMVFAVDAKNKDKEKGRETVSDATEVQASAQDDDEGEWALGSTSSFEFESSLAWANSGTASATDWRAKKNGLQFGINADRSLDLRLRNLPGLSTGVLVHFEGEGAFNTLSPGSADPYMVLNRADLTSLVSGYLGTETTLGGAKMQLRGTLDGGLRILDLTDADSAYLPSGADSEAFWFRVLPMVGSSQKLVVQGDSWTLKAKNQFLLWWDAESAYGRSWTPGFEDGFEVSLGIPFFRGRRSTWDGELVAGQTWNSGILIPSLKSQVGLRTTWEEKKVGRLRLTPIGYEFQADLSGFSLSKAQDVENLVSGKLDWTGAGANWGLGLQWPWSAWDASGTSDESLKRWKLMCKIDF